MARRRLFLLVLLAAAIAAPSLSRAADAGRGRALYELRCGGCHTESVHGREHRVARDLGEVSHWVRRWSANLELGWGNSEVEDVTAYLNATYYRFACEAPGCRALSLNKAPSPR